MPDLFDEIERTDPSPAWPAEDSFSFLNRADGPTWRRQRELLDCFYGAFPDPSGDLRARFRSRDPRQHYPAWWELYVHALFKALGFDVTVHPNVPGTPGHPDFLVERGPASLYIEAATVFSGMVSRSRTSRTVAALEDVIDRMDASTFSVALRVDRVGTSTPPLTDVREQISAWAATLDPNEVDKADPASLSFWKAFEFKHGWTISLRPMVWAPKHRGCPDNRFLGLRVANAGFVDDVPKLRNAITRKGKRYGTPDKPLLVAVLAVNGFVDDRALVGALFGSEAVRFDRAPEHQRIVRNRDGVWIGSRGVARRRISGVLFGVGILPHTVASAWPTLWHHFDPTFPLTTHFPFRATHLVDDALESLQASESASRVFGLPGDWPGPEPPFRLCEHRPGDHTGSGYSATAQQA